MKKLKKDLEAVTKEFKALTRKTEAMAKKVAKLEKAQTAAKRKVKPKVTKKAPARKKVAAKKKTVAKKKPTAKKATAPTATDRVLGIIKRSKRGVDVPTLIKKTGLGERTVRNILFRAGKLRKIKRAGRGIYVGA
jgi:predicted RNase H-like nuclease (RuvC/YqgF family)